LNASRKGRLRKRKWKSMSQGEWTLFYILSIFSRIVQNITGKKVKSTLWICNCINKSILEIRIKNGN
jgi:hypothetical protein